MDTFHTQHSINTFMKCPQSYKLKYIDNIRLPEIMDDRQRKNIERGSIFHLMARRYFMGIDPGRVPDAYPELEEYIQRLKECFPITPEYIYLPEYRLRIQSGGSGAKHASLSLEANFDILVIKKREVCIWDWKTGSVKEDSLQTVLYMFVLAEGARIAAGREIKPEDISMTYWQPVPPYAVNEITYDGRLHDINRDRLEKLVYDVENYNYAKFDRKEYKDLCPACSYRAVCDARCSK